tara:strand:- start:17319 stop:18728 length:1410 start_codon:yes stop_codon:yes gene_type:complete
MISGFDDFCPEVIFAEEDLEELEEERHMGGICGPYPEGANNAPAGGTILVAEKKQMTVSGWEMIFDLADYEGRKAEEDSRKEKRRTEPVAIHDHIDHADMGILEALRAEKWHEEERKKRQIKVRNNQQQSRQAQGEKMQLPTEKTKKENSPNKLTVTLHGPPKIGKTTFISKMDNVLIIATEAGHKHIEAYVQPVSSWMEFLQTAKALTTEEHQFKGVAIDTVDNLVQLCRAHVLDEINRGLPSSEKQVKDESDLGFGKGYKLVQREFSRVLDKLTLMMGVWFISHTAEKEIENYLGKRHTKRVPSLPNKQREYITGLSDCILFADLEQEEGGRFSRVLRCQNSNDWEAGDRSGLLPRTLPLDYNAFINCFEGETFFQQAREITGADTINAAIAFAHIDDLRETAEQLMDEQVASEYFEPFQKLEIKSDSQAAKIIVDVQNVFDAQTSNLAHIMSGTNMLPLEDGNKEA